MDVTFHSPEEVPLEAFLYAVIPARFQGQWIFCKHRLRDTWELPGGHREPGEDILAAAHRELQEETGAQEYTLRPLCAYCVSRDGQPSYGLLCLAEVSALGPLPDLEIEKIALFESPPQALTYPGIIPHLMGRAIRALEGEIR